MNERATQNSPTASGRLTKRNSPFIEGFFSKLTRESLKRGVFRSVDDLEKAITRYIAATNMDPKPFVWTATAKAISAKLALNHPSESVHLPIFGRLWSLKPDPVRFDIRISFQLTVTLRRISVMTTSACRSRRLSRLRRTARP